VITSDSEREFYDGHYAQFLSLPDHALRFDRKVLEYATSTSGTFYLSDTSNNRVLAIEAANLRKNSLFASVGSLNAFVEVDQKTGLVKPLVKNLNGPHGNLFLPQ